MRGCRDLIANILINKISLAQNQSSLRTQTYFRLSFLFGGETRQPEIRLRSQAKSELKGKIRG